MMTHWIPAHCQFTGEPRDATALKWYMVAQILINPAAAQAEEYRNDL